MKINFTKMHGCGNDYIYIDCLDDNIKIDNVSKLAIKLSDRHFSVGADGLVLILPSSKADCKMKMLNSDGSEGNMCGNAVRCIAKYIYEKRHVISDKISIETLSGIKYLKLKIKDGEVTQIEVDMGKAILDSKLIPVHIDKHECVNESICINRKNYYITCVSMGNPHCVVFTDNVNKVDIDKLGPKFEKNKIFPNRINTEFVQINSKNKITMRVWERGSGETLACGTGACASVVASVINGFCVQDEEVVVNLKGGKLKVTYGSDGTVIMKGPAEIVFSGQLDLK